MFRHQISIRDAICHMLHIAIEQDLPAVYTDTIILKVLEDQSKGLCYVEFIHAVDYHYIKVEYYDPEDEIIAHLSS